MLLQKVIRLLRWWFNLQFIFDRTKSKKANTKNTQKYDGRGKSIYRVNSEKKIPEMYSAARSQPSRVHPTKNDRVLSFDIKWPYSAIIILSALCLTFFSEFTVGKVNKTEGPHWKKTVKNTYFMLLFSQRAVYFWSGLQMEKEIRKFLYLKKWTSRTIRWSGSWLHTKTSDWKSKWKIWSIKEWRNVLPR